MQIQISCFRSQLIWIYTACRIYPGSAWPELKLVFSDKKEYAPRKAISFLVQNIFLFQNFDRGVADENVTIPLTPHAIHVYGPHQATKCYCCTVIRFVVTNDLLAYSEGPDQCALEWSWISIPTAGFPSSKTSSPSADPLKEVPLLQFFLWLVMVIASVLLCLVTVCLSFLLVSVPREGWVLWMWFCHHLLHFKS